MFTLEGKLALKQVVEQGFEEIRQGFLEELKKAIEALLRAERDRHIAALRQEGKQVYRWGYTVCKFWQRQGGSLEQVHVPRLRGRQEGWEGGVSVFQGYSKSTQATGTARPGSGRAALTTSTPSIVVWSTSTITQAGGV